ncbi:hypothetical protein [Vibrio phage BONAISHI]|nr:hypothetical protein [Vibrio phage BONAISHI]
MLTNVVRVGDYDLPILDWLCSILFVLVVILGGFSYVLSFADMTPGYFTDFYIKLSITIFLTTGVATLPLHLRKQRNF